MKIYEYAVIRYVPDVEREEFVNIGLLMMCKRDRWMNCYINLRKECLHAMMPDCDLEQLAEHLKQFEALSRGDKCYGVLAQMPVEERFRWLTAIKSATLQTSRPHPGTTEDLEETYRSLCSRLVD